MSTVREKIIDALTLFWAKISTVLVRKANIVDNCASTSTEYPLSANQGTQLQSQIDELNSNLTNWHEIYKVNEEYISTTNLTYTGMNVTIPANSVYCITALAQWINAYPTKVEICGSSSSSTNVLGYNSGTISPLTTTVSGKTKNEPKTFYLWAEYSDSSVNRVLFNGWYHVIN